MYISLYIYTRVYIHTCMCIYTYIHVYTCTCICTYSAKWSIHGTAILAHFRHDSGHHILYSHFTFHMAFACLIISDLSRVQTCKIHDSRHIDFGHPKSIKKQQRQDQTSGATVSPRPCMISPWPTRAIKIWRGESANTPGMSTSRHKLTRPDEKPWKTRCWLGWPL